MIKQPRKKASKVPVPPDSSVIACDGQPDYEGRVREFTDYWKPKNDVEQSLVADIALFKWLGGRALHMQEDFLAAHPAGEKSAVSKEMSLLFRYQATNERALQGAVAMLHDLREHENLEESEFVSQKVKSKRFNPNDGNPWMRTDLNPATECGWADPITGKFTSFGDAWATEIAEEEARKLDLEPAA